MYSWLVRKGEIKYYKYLIILKGTKKREEQGHKTAGSKRKNNSMGTDK